MTAHQAPAASLAAAAMGSSRNASPPKVTAPKTSLVEKLVSGAIAGVIGTSIIFPIDSIKTRLQAGNTYKGGVDAFRTIVRMEGVRGLYKGLPANLVGVIPEKAIKLAMNDHVRGWLATRNYHAQVRKLTASSSPSAKADLEKITTRGIDPDGLSIPLGMLAGAAAGLTQVVATAPMENVKLNLQLSKAGISTVSMVRNLGLKGLYRGTPATLLRDIPFSFLFFPSSSYLRELAADRDRQRGGTGKVPFSVVFWSGIGAGVLAAGAVTPLDTIKTRVQYVRPDGFKYDGIMHAAKDIYQKEGAMAFMRSAPQRCMIIAPLFGITMLVYEVQQRFFGKSSK